VNLSINSAGSRRVVTFLAAAAALMFAQAASAAVAAGDTFTFDVSGYNNAGTTGYIVGGGTATFGQTSTVTAVNGVVYTISSSEVVGATTTTDSFKVTAPTNFLTAAKLNGTTIAVLQFDLGNANSGVIGGTVDPVNLSGAITTDTSTGNIVYSGGNFTLTPSVTLSSDGLSFAAVEGVNAGGSALYSLAIKEFDFSITYANPTVSAVPETNNWALLLGGLGVMGFVGRRSRKA
jgi:hypothetical protein